MLVLQISITDRSYAYILFKRVQLDNKKEKNNIVVKVRGEL